MSTITVPIDGIGNENESFLISHYEEMSEIMEEAGYPNNLMSLIAPDDGDIELPDGVAITPSFTKQVRDAIQKCQLPFTLDEDIDGCYGDAPGSANTTTTYNKTGMAMREAIDILDKTGQLEQAAKILEVKRDEEQDPETSEILTYAMATLSKGWRAEKFFDEDPRFAKLSMSADEGGYDLFDRENRENIQLKPVTTLYSNGESEFEEKEQKHLFYQWTSDGNLEFAETQSARDMVKREAKKAGLPSTLLGKSTDELKVAKRYGRSFRFLWW